MLNQGRCRPALPKFCFYDSYLKVRYGKPTDCDFSLSISCALFAEEASGQVYFGEETLCIYARELSKDLTTLEFQIINLEIGKTSLVLLIRLQMVFISFQLIFFIL